MRDIKFREWCVIENKMYAIDLYSECLRSGDSFKTMQFTGLKDKNGIEIYTDDIVQIDDVLGKIITTYIYYSLGAFRYRHDDGSGSVLDMITTSKVKGYESVTKDIEVVGNIYENPELFEEIESLKNNS